MHLDDDLTDKGSLAKLRDCFPLNIFNIRNSLTLFFSSNQETFFFILIFALWNESILNTKISTKLRAFYLKALLNIFLQYLQHSKKCPSIMTGFHKSNRKPYVFFATPSKRRRIIITIFVQLIYLKYGNVLYALNRFGSHD